MNEFFNNALLYSIGWFYVEFNQFVLRQLLQDTAPLAKQMDCVIAPATGWLDLYIYLTVVGVWAIFNGVRRAYFKLQNVPVS